MPRLGVQIPPCKNLQCQAKEEIPLPHNQFAHNIALIQAIGQTPYMLGKVHNRWSKVWPLSRSPLQEHL